jgi:hypothetical protein
MTDASGTKAVAPESSVAFDTVTSVLSDVQPTPIPVTAQGVPEASDPFLLQPKQLPPPSTTTTSAPAPSAVEEPAPPPTKPDASIPPLEKPATSAEAQPSTKEQPQFMPPPATEAAAAATPTLSGTRSFFGSLLLSTKPELKCLSHSASHFHTHECG